MVVARLVTLSRLTFSLPLDPARLLRARQRIRDYLHVQRVDPCTIDEVVLAIAEAMTNAVRHSGARDDLEVRLCFEQGDLHAEVRDYGIGFDVDGFDSTKRPKLLGPGGRGLYLIAQLMDELKLRRDGGLEVTMVKRGVLRDYPQEASPATAIADGATLVGTGYREERQRAFVEEIEEGFAALDWEYRVTYVNHAGLRLYARDRERVLGQSIWDLFPSIREGPLGHALRQAMEMSVPSILEFHSDVIGRWLECRFYPTSSGVSFYLRDIDHRKRKELERDDLLERLQSNQVMLERSQELAHLGSWELDLTSGRLTWSDEVYRIFGLDPQEFGATYEAFLERVHPDDRASVDAAYSGSLSENRDSYEIEHRVVREDSGEIRFVHERCDHLRDESGTIVRSVGMVHDITERERAEEALQESERRQRFALQHAPAAIYEIDFRPPGPRFVSVNDYMCTYSGYSRKELLSMSPFAFLDEEGQALFRSRIAAALAGETMPSEVEYGFRTKGGEERITALQVTPVFEDGRPVRGFVVAHDVTEYKRLEAELAAREEQSRHLVRYAAAAIYEADLRERRFVSVNDQMCELTGYSREELLAMNPLELLDQEGRERLLQRTQDMIAGRYDGEPVEYQITTRDGERRWAVLNVSPVLEGGRPVRAFVVAHDISARKRAEQERERLIAELSQTTERVSLLADVVEQHAVPFGIGAPDGRLLLFNQAFADLTGYSREELQARELTWATDLTPPEWREREAETLATAVNERKAVRYEKEYLRKDGTRVPIELFVQPVFDGDGNLMHYRSFLTGITERKRSEEALRLSEERYRAIVELATEALVVEADGSYTMDSKARHGDGGAHRWRLALVEAIAAQRRHPVRTLLLALILEVAYLVPLGLGGTRDVLGMPGSLLALTVIVVGAVAGTWAGVASALGGTVIFYATVAGFGQDASPLATLISAGIWVALAVLASLFADALLEQSARRRAAAVALARAETSRQAQSAELRDMQRIATTLQESLIHPLPAVDGLEIAVRSLPANQPELVGGDFSDAFLLPEGQVAVVIGDVAGKGIAAAGLTETVRSTMRAFATVDATPAFVLGKTNQVLLAAGPEEVFVTALVVVLDPQSGHLSLGSAGHPPPVHLTAGSCAPLEPIYGPPLGSFPSEYTSTHARLALDDYLVLYTDGVTEATKDGQLFGERRLIETVEQLRGRPVQTVAEGVRDAATAYAGQLRDDLEVIALRLK